MPIVGAVTANERRWHKIGTLYPADCYLIVQVYDRQDDMQFDDTKSGDHLEKRLDEPAAIVANIPERQGVTRHNVRYVLAFGIAGVVVAFAIILVSYFD